MTRGNRQQATGNQVRLFCCLLPVACCLVACGRAEVAQPFPVSGQYTRHISGDWHRGQADIEKYGCGSCHVIPGAVGARGLVGPPLTDWSQRTVIAGKLPNTEDNLVAWIKDPQSVWPGNDMPNLGVTDAEAHDIAAYLYTIR